MPDVGLEVEIEDDVDENQPNTSAALPQGCSKRKKYSKKEPLVWKKVDITPVNAKFAEKFSPPPGELPSPY